MTAGADDRPAVRPLDWVRLLSRAEPPFSTSAVYAAALKLAERAEGSGKRAGSCYASAAEFARVGLSPSAAYRARQELITRGFLIELSRGGRAGNGKTYASSYRLTAPRSTDHQRPIDRQSQSIKHERSSDHSADHVRPIETEAQPVTGDGMSEFSIGQRPRLNRSPTTAQERVTPRELSSSWSENSPRRGEQDPRLQALAAHLGRDRIADQRAGGQR